MELITQAMLQTVQSRFGQSLAGEGRVPGVTTAGKSGIAEVGETVRPHSWFIGFAPAEQPRIAIAVASSGLVRQ